MNEDQNSNMSVERIIEDMIRGLTVITEACDVPFYLFNNDENRFLHISSAFSELTGIGYADFRSSRITDFSHLVHEKDMELMYEMFKKSGELLAHYRDAGQSLYRMVFLTNFRIMTDRGYMFIDHRSYPLYLDESPLPLISANFLQPSHKRGIDRLTFHAFGRDIRLLYSQKQKKFVPEDKMRLKNVEIEILRLSSEGLIEKQICDRLGVKQSKVNYYKREIFNKLNVTSIQEAVYVALLSGLI